MMGTRNLLALMALLLVPTLLAQVQPIQQELFKNGLFNDKSGADAFWVMRPGGLGTMEVVPSKEENASGTMTIKVNDISPKPWSMELMQQVEAGVPKDTVVFISFDYKISPGYSFNFYWQEERDPWPKLISLHIDSPTETWQRVQMAVPIHEELKPLGTSFSFHLAENVGICELRNISAKVLPEGTDPEKLNTNVSPVLGGDFYDKDWRQATSDKLDLVRKVPVRLNAVKQNPPRANTPIANATASFRQTSRQFRFGIETSSAVILPKVLEVKDNKAKRKALAKHSDALAKYREMALDKSMFDFITLTDAFTWRDYSSWGKLYDNDIIDAIQKSGLSLRGPALYTPAFIFAPVPCRKMNKDDLKQALINHVAELTKRHSGKIAEWEVLHGGIDYTEIYNIIGADSMLQVFKTAAEMAPDASLLISDPSSLTSITDSAMKSNVELAEWLIQSGVKVSGIVLGANMKRLEVAPQTMEKRLEYISQHIKLPLHISDFTVNNESDEFQAAAVSDYLLLFYSHPSVQSVSFAEGWAPMLLNPKTAYYKDDLTPRQSMQTIQSLLKDKWLSKATLTTDTNGLSGAVPLFKGVYEIEFNAKETSNKLTLDLEKFLNAEKEPVKFEGGQAIMEKGEIVLTFFVE